MNIRKLLSRKIIVPITLTLGFVLLILTGANWFSNNSTAEAQENNPTEKFVKKTSLNNPDVCRTILEYIQKHYVKKGIADQVNYGYNQSNQLCNSVVEILNTRTDPLSRRIPPKKYKEMKNRKQNRFGGIGAYTAIKNGQLTVIAPISGTPADKVGLRPRDVITKINGNSIDKISKVSRAVEMLRGPIATDVKVTLDRAGRTLERTMTRRKISTDPVFFRLLTGERKIGYVKITNFDRNTHESPART